MRDADSRHPPRLVDRFSHLGTATHSRRSLSEMMKKEIDPRADKHYSDAPADVEEALRSARKIEDELPLPEHLVKKKQSITIRLDSDVVEWCKQQGGKYQSLINEVLRRYKEHFQGRNAG